MLKNTVEILGKVLAYKDLDRIEKALALLKEWANSIVDECAGSFECTMEDNKDYAEHMGVSIDNQPKHPVLVRHTILDVKNKIK